MDAFRVSPTESQVAVYLKAVAEFDMEAVRAGVDRFIKDEVPWFDRSRAPYAPELVREVSLHHRNLHRGENNVLVMRPEHGHIDVDYGYGSITLVGLTRAEVEKVDEWNGRTPDGRNLAGMTIEQIREALTQPALPMPTPKLKRMT